MAEQPIRIDPGEEPPGIDGASGEAVVLAPASSTLAVPVSAALALADLVFSVVLKVGGESIPPVRAKARVTRRTAAGNSR